MYTYDCKVEELALANVQEKKKNKGRNKKEENSINLLSKLWYIEEIFKIFSFVSSLPNSHVTALGNFMTMQTERIP